MTDRRKTSSGGDLPETIKLRLEDLGLDKETIRDLTPEEAEAALGGCCANKCTVTQQNLD